jgi:hypothetical protein
VAAGIAATAPGEAAHVLAKAWLASGHPYLGWVCFLTIDPSAARRLAPFLAPVASDRP